MSLFWQQLLAWRVFLEAIIPNLIIASVILVIFYFLGKLLANYLKRQYELKKKKSLGKVLGDFSNKFFIAIGILLFFNILLPSIKLSNVMDALGFSSIAVSFAFKDILQNWLSGVLLLIKQPFQIGDTIVINNCEGVVRRIESRATILRTYDSEKIVIPNSLIFTSAIHVKTAFKKRRNECFVLVSHTENIRQVMQTIKYALNNDFNESAIVGVEVYVDEIGPNWVKLKIRWWVNTVKIGMLVSKSSVLSFIKEVFDQYQISTPYYINELHDCMHSV
jgi:small-conductance mechanosensitive channel